MRPVLSRAFSQSTAGRITFEDVVNVLPFGNTLVVLNVTGAQLKRLLEHGVHRHDLSGKMAPAEFVIAAGAYLFLSGGECGARRCPQVSREVYTYGTTNADALPKGSRKLKCGRRPSPRRQGPVSQKSRFQRCRRWDEKSRQVENAAI
ncbi:hypothetical protein V5799_020235 [Amblyomma americanum]|uniref:5'-nucleotidase n=1 Tax=Amblyomma americanum TaxID=6943 RepID=A0AAQ4EVB5_AMBAM